MALVGDQGLTRLVECMYAPHGSLSLCDLCDNMVMMILLKIENILDIRQVQIFVQWDIYILTRLPGAVPQPLFLLLIVFGCIIFFEVVFNFQKN